MPVATGSGRVLRFACGFSERVPQGWFRVLVVMLACCSASTGLTATEIASPDSLPDFVVNWAMARIPGGEPIFLSVDAGRYSDRIFTDLKMELMKSGRTLITKPADSGIVVTISDLSVEKITGFRTLFWDYRMVETEHRFVFQAEEAGSGRILVVDECYFHTGEPVNLASATPVQLDWYDPVLITAIVGGMVYLFYYGSN